MEAKEEKWSAPEFDTRPKDVSWYWLTIIVAVIILGLAIWQKNFLFGFFVVLAEILFLVWGNKEARMVDFSLSADGIGVGENKHHEWKEMEGFSLIENPGREWQDLFLHFKSRLKPSLRIKVLKGRSAAIKKFIVEFLPEADHQPSLLDTLEEFIGF